jgi:hypothetical protein
MRPPPAPKNTDTKSPRPVSRRGLNSFDVKHMPVICPTCQIFSKKNLAATQGCPRLEVEENNGEPTAKYRIDGEEELFECIGDHQGGCGAKLNAGWTRRRRKP